jgi:hypothetical protein
MHLVRKCRDDMVKVGDCKIESSPTPNLSFDFADVTGITLDPFTHYTALTNLRRRRG